MTSENKTWDSLKAKYLGQVAKALSSVKHPRTKDVLEDVRCHLERRFAELEPDEQTRENLEKIIAEMGPASDYAELLEPDAISTKQTASFKYLVWAVSALIGITAVMILLSLVISYRAKPVTAEQFHQNFSKNIGRFNIDTATVKDVIKTFGKPIEYIWGNQTLDRNNLPSRYVVVYPNGFQVLLSQGKVVEIRFEHEQPKDYLFLGKLRVGSSLDEVLEVIGQPSETVEGREIGWVENVLYKDIDGRKGHCYYHRPDKNVRIFFGDYKVAALYITHSDYGAGRGEKVLEKADLPATVSEAAAKAIAQIEGEGEKLVWGEEVNGLRAAVEFLPEKECYSSGEEIGVRFHIQNVTDRTIAFTTAIWRNDKTNCVIQDSFGKNCEVTSHLYLGDVQLIRKTLSPRQIVILESASLAVAKSTVEAGRFSHPVGHVAILKPGQYSLHYELLFPDVESYYPDGTRRVAKPGDWEGTLVTGKRRLCINSANESYAKPTVQVEGEITKGLEVTNGLGFLMGIPEFRDLRLKTTEHQLVQHLTQYSLAVDYHKSNDESTYHLYTETGENVIVMFHKGLCTGIQRMQPDSETAIKLFEEKRLNGPKQTTAVQVEIDDRKEIPVSRLIVPGQRVGDFNLGMSKDDVLESLGKPKMIFHSGERYTLENLPRKYFMVFDDISFGIVDDSVEGIGVLSPLYKFANGLGVGDSEQKIKQAFGDDFHLKETEGKDFLTYEDEGLEFEIHKKDRTVMEIGVSHKIPLGHGRSLAKPIKSVKPYDDVRWKDLSKFDLSARKRLIATLTFNQKTVWPERAKMPPGGDPNKILTDALNPGLGIRELHQQGVTGKGVNVAIIDQPVYLVHPEFAGKIVAYHDTGYETDESSMHGPLVASLLVGTNCGTAPGARVYYAAAPSWKMDAAYYAKGLDWIIAQNEKLPEEEKIRVVSVSASPNQSSWANRQMWDRACARAEANGIMVLDCTDDSHRGFIGKCWYNARVPESVAQCNPWDPPNREFRFNPNGISILVPSSPRTAAEDGSVPGYQYAGRGGLSRAIPYCAGVLAMGWQIRPKLTSEQMRELLFKSAYTKKNGAKIINPKKFIRLVKTAKVQNRRFIQRDNIRSSRKRY